MNPLTFALIGAVAMFALPVFAHEVTTLESITVTAQQFEQGLQDVPIAITAIDRKELQRNGITTVGESLSATPSITIAPYVNSTNTFFIYMRGFAKSQFFRSFCGKCNGVQRGATGCNGGPSGSKLGARH